MIANLSLHQAVKISLVGHWDTGCQHARLSVEVAGLADIVAGLTSHWVAGRHIP